MLHKECHASGQEVEGLARNGYVEGGCFCLCADRLGARTWMSGKEDSDVSGGLVSTTGNGNRSLENTETVGSKTVMKH